MFCCMRYLGLDLGSKTLGMAISDYTGMIATRLDTLYFEDEDYDSLLEPLKKIVTLENVEKIVLGLPKNMDNSIGTRASITLEFKDKLESYLGLEVIMEDERLTSVISNQVLIDANMSRKKRKKKVDGVAAVLILQSYLDKIGNMKKGDL